MGMELKFVKGEGPQFPTPVRTQDALDALPITAGITTITVEQGTMLQPTSIVLNHPNLDLTIVGNGCKISLARSGDGLVIGGVLKSLVITWLGMVS